ncbi:MAG: GDSL-type esterase/lipase family protein [Actinomycetota bacterium]|nr:GDSL-type esterase/lipase family protein [Actinomycetota bacterium]
MLAILGTLLVVSAASIAFALQVTPERSVQALGQTVTVGTAPPTWSLEGPGQAVLFGQTIDTQVRFIGPVRPRLTLTDISIDAQVAGLFSPGPHTPVADTLGSALASGWRWYFAYEIGFVALGAVLLLGAIAGWRRYHGRRTVVAIVGGLLFVEAINLGAIMVTAFTAPGVLRDVRSLDALVGREQQAPIPTAPGREHPGVQAVVLGDSTAAGLGGPPIPDASASDQACQRSSFAFADTLALVNGWKVDNLACSGATIDSGILGPQFVGGQTLAPQLARAKRSTHASYVIVSVGANDLHWNTLIRLCAVADSCDNRAPTAYFQRALDSFTRDYFGLLTQLATLPGDPTIVINQYYVPFDPSLDCLTSSGLTADKIEVLLQRLQTLNDVLANGARTFGYLTVQPDFAGHELCTDQSYVQGAADPAPLHPNARGQLAIAIADERVILEGG